MIRTLRVVSGNKNSIQKRSRLEVKAQKVMEAEVKGKKFPVTKPGSHTSLTADLSVGRSIKGLGSLAADALAYASQHGLVVLPGGSCPEGAVIHAPVSVLPTPFPKSLHSQAWAMMPTLNRLTDAVSEDEEFLKSTLELASQYDDFTANLLRVYNSTKKERKARVEVTIGILRSDYMFDEPSERLLQVELNTIASSFGALGSIVSNMHRHIVQRCESDLDVKGVPDNPALLNIAKTLAVAHETVKLPKSVIIMVAQDGEKNRYDQEWLATTVWEHFGYRTVRCSLTDIGLRGRVDTSGTLWLDDTPVSVVYFRSGYGPTDYPTDIEWKARELVEKSKAAKCPSVAYQLAGTKKVQQELAKPGVLERFLSEEDCERVRPFFAGLWGLEDLEASTTKDVLSKAIQSPEGFVLKPQREGGGHNLYGEEAKEVLKKGEGLAAYILMERIKPPVNTCVLMRNGEWILEDTLSELGIYGGIVKKGDHVILNEAAGHLLRTKVSSSDEGGVAAGFAVLDSPYMLD